MHMQPHGKNSNQSHKPDHHCAKYINESASAKVRAMYTDDQVLQHICDKQVLLETNKSKGHTRSNSGPETTCTVEYRVLKTMEY